MNALELTALTRGQLYAMIWQEPTRTVAARLGISDVGLAKICRKLHIPRPWRGYWREKETGHRPRQPKLPPWPSHLGKEPEAITFRPQAPPAPGTPVPTRPPEPETVQAQRAHEASPEHRITVAKTLTDPDRLVRRAVRLLKRPRDRNLLEPSERPCLGIHVTKESLDRALRLFDAIVEAVRARGWSMETQSGHPFQTQVTVLGEAVGICIIEKTRQVENPKPSKADTTHFFSYQRYSYEPTGRLTIRLADGPSFSWGAMSWNDGKVQRLENCLSDVMIGLVQMAERKREARREQQRRERERLEEQHRQMLAAERREREKDRREELKAQIEGWSRAREIRAYLSALETAAADVVQRESDGRLARWIRWAKQYADRIDTLREVEALPLDPDGYGRRPLDLEAFALSAPKP